MGPRNRTTAKCPKIASRKAAKTSPRQDSRNQQIYGETPTMRNNQSREGTIRGQLFLRKEGRWKTTTSTGLLTTEQIHEEKLKRIPINSPSNRQISRMHPVYKIRYQMGVQQHQNQGRRRMESRVSDAPRPLRTPCNVLWTHKLPGNVSSNDEQNLQNGSGPEMAVGIHG